MILSDLLFPKRARNWPEPSGSSLAGCELTGREASELHSHAKHGNENK